MACHACIELHDAGQNSVALKSKNLATMAFKKVPLKPWPAYPLQNYICFFRLTSGLEGFGHKSTTSDMPWIEAYCPKSYHENGWVLECWKVNFLECLGHAGNSWKLFSFQPAFRAFQQPHKYSYSLQLAIHTQLAHHYIQYALCALWHLKGPLATSMWHAPLLIPVATMGKCQQL